jgi:hypothetical protein
MGNSSSDILALGIHRESFNTFDTPLFLAEMRRRVFSKAYYLDVIVSAMFDRPPRLTKRLSDCQMPLDLREEELVSVDPTFEEARARLGSDGWATDGRFVQSSFTRMRLIAAEIKEEVLEHEFRPITPARVEHLRSAGILHELACTDVNVQKLGHPKPASLGPIASAP